MLPWLAQKGLVNSDRLADLWVGDVKYGFRYHLITRQGARPREVLLIFSDRDRMGFRQIEGRLVRLVPAAASTGSTGTRQRIKGPAR
jgi:hypothetical protein